MELLWVSHKMQRKQFLIFWLLGYAGWVGEALYSLSLQRITVREALNPPLISILWKQALLNGVIVAAACLAGGLLQERVLWPSRVGLRTVRDVAWACGIGIVFPTCALGHPKVCG